MNRVEEPWQTRCRASLHGLVRRFRTSAHQERMSEMGAQPAAHRNPERPVSEFVGRSPYPVVGSQPVPTSAGIPATSCTHARVHLLARSGCGPVPTQPVAEAGHGGAIPGEQGDALPKLVMVCMKTSPPWACPGRSPGRKLGAKPDPHWADQQPTQHWQADGPCRRKGSYLS